MPPPKLSLAISVEPEPSHNNNANMVSIRATGWFLAQWAERTLAWSRMQASIRMSDDSLTVLTQSYNPVSFTTEGMRKNDGLFYKAGAEL